MIRLLSIAIATAMLASCAADAWIERMNDQTPVDEWCMQDR